MENKDFKKLKKQFISQAAKTESNRTESPTLGTGIKTNVSTSSPKNIYVAKPHLYLISDLKRILLITFIALIALFVIYFVQKNSQVFSDFGNFLYRVLHLS